MKVKDGVNGKNGEGVMSGEGMMWLMRLKFVDEVLFTRRRKFLVLFYSKEMEFLV